MTTLEVILLILLIHSVNGKKLITRINCSTPPPISFSSLRNLKTYSNITEIVYITPDIYGQLSSTFLTRKTKICSQYNHCTLIYTLQFSSAMLILQQNFKEIAE